MDLAEAARGGSGPRNGYDRNPAPAPRSSAAHTSGAPMSHSGAERLGRPGDVADQLVRAFAPRRVFDAGCARGALVAALWDRGVEARGRDISHLAIAEARADLRWVCEVGSIADPIDGDFDLVTCIDVLEHMPEADAMRAIASMASVTSTIVFSSLPAPVDRDSQLNARPPLYWLRVFAQHGFAPLAGFDATFVNPHSFVLRKVDVPPSDDELRACADRVRLSVRCHELEEVSSRLADEVAELRTAARSARLDAEAARRAASEAEARVETTRKEAEAARSEAEAARADAAAARADADAARVHASMLLTSTTWRATALARSTVSRLPPPARRLLRRGAKALWWGLTPWRMPERLALIKARRRQDTVYDRWVREYDTLSDTDRAAIRAHAAELQLKPLISVVIPVYNTPERHLRACIESVLGQLYPHWELCIADDASTAKGVRRVLQSYQRRDPRIKVVYRSENGNISAATNSAIGLASGELVALLDHDDILSEHALYEIAVEINAHPQADVVYSDSDTIAERGHRWLPYFKTDWDPDLMLGHNMVSHLGVYRRSLLTQIGGLRVGFEGSQDYDLMLRAAEATTPDRIRHVPAILYHWRRNAAAPSFSETDLARCVDAARRAISEHLARTGRSASVEPAPGMPNFSRVVYRLPAERPLVSIIVPIRDRPDLLERCARGVLDGTSYAPLELLVVDNDSAQPETQSLLDRLGEDPRVRILRHPGAFNFSAINNRAVQDAKGDIVVLMNNDIEVISPSWLDEMVAQALRPEVGAVGAKLLYGDGRVQHAGVVLGVGHGAGHFFHLASRHEPGHFGFLGLCRQVSAVTAACMALRRSVYLEAGGLDEDNLPIAFNDVDLCLRIRNHGYAVLWTPFAELIHHESATRGSDASGESQARFEREARCLRERWGDLLSRDPFYNPNCTTAAATFAPAFPPGRPKPWLARHQESLADSGATERKAADKGSGVTVAASRAEQLLAPIGRSARIIELGPSYNPIAPKSEGWRTVVVDHATRAELVRKYTGHAGVDVSRIEDVDFVWNGELLTQAVPHHLHGSFDALIASHVIEHTTDIIGFLSAAEVLLSPAGVVILAVPDKRYCFDYFRPASTTGEVLYAEGRMRHTCRIVFDHTAYAVRNSGQIAWGQAPLGRLEFIQPLDAAWRAFSTVSEDPASPYVDMHAWQFTPASFELLLLELARLGKTDWQCQHITAASGCEFHAFLRRGGKAAAAHSSQGDLDARRIELLERSLLEARDQIEFLTASSRETARGP